MRPVEFWFDFASTYSYPAAMRAEALAATHGVPLIWRPFLLGPIFRTQGWDNSPFNLYPAKGRYMWRDLERLCAELALPLKRPSAFPRNGLLPARVICAHPEAPWVPAFARAIFRANFEHDLDIADPAVVAECLRTLGLQPELLLGAAGQPTAKEALRRESDEAARRGLFGSPSFTVGDELFWGNDRLESALRWAARH